MLPLQLPLHPLPRLLLLLLPLLAAGQVSSTDLPAEKDTGTLIVLVVFAVVWLLIVGLFIPRVLGWLLTRFIQWKVSARHDPRSSSQPASQPSSAAAATAFSHTSHTPHTHLTHHTHHTHTTHTLSLNPPPSCLAPTCVC
jgi:hypothetical protein